MQDSRSSLFLGSLIGGGIGYLLLIFTDFGGWYNYDSYYGIRSSGSVGPGDFGGFLLLAVIGLPLLYGALVSLKGLRNPSALTAKAVTRAYRLMVFEFGFILFGAAAFFVLLAWADDAWLEAGFFGSAIGSLLALVCLRMNRKAYAAAETQAPQVPVMTPGAFPMGMASPVPAGAWPQAAYPAYGPPGPAVAPMAPQGSPGTDPSAMGPSVVVPAGATAAARFCRQCGGPLPAAARFCRACGSAMQ